MGGIIWKLVGSYVSVGFDYIIAAAMIAGGVYLAAFLDLASTNPLAWLLRPLRYVGYALVAGGIALGCYTYGKTLGLREGSAAVEAEWKQKNLEAQIDRLRQEAQAQKEAADLFAQRSKELDDEKATMSDELEQYRSAAEKLAACRHASGDDDRRLCQLIGSGSAGCKPAK